MQLTNGLVKQLVIVTVVAMVASVVGADIVATGIGTDSNAMESWQGRVEYRGFSNVTAADVEYAVYAPGQFELSYAGMDPSEGEEYVYAYQVLNDLQPHPTLLNTIATVTLFSVEIYDEMVSSIGSVSGSGDVAATTASIIPVTARWDFTGDGQIEHPMTSEVLIFTSSQPPMLRNASLSGSAGGAGTHQLPSPTPEPSAVVLLGIGLAAAGIRRRY